jgi:dihydroxyacetone kinase-like protein
MSSEERLHPQESADLLTLEQVRAWLLRYADCIDERAVELTELDAAIGDADHGANMVRGMHRVRARLRDEEAAADIGSLLRTVAMTLISSVGGAAGPLYGAFFLRAARDPSERNAGGDAAAPVITQQAISATQLARMFEAGVEGVQQRGKARLEEKTMLDVLSPASQALAQAADAGSSLRDAVAAALAAAESGLRHTVDLEALKGRASYLGTRSIGHQDPGATSSYYLVESLAWVVGLPVQDASPSGRNEPATAQGRASLA